MAQSHQASQKLNWPLAHWLPSLAFCLLPLSIPRHSATGKEVSAGPAHHTALALSQPNSMSLLFPDQDGTRLPKPAFTFISQDLGQQICSELSAQRP